MKSNDHKDRTRRRTGLKLFWPSTWGTSSAAFTFILLSACILCSGPLVAQDVARQDEGPADWYADAFEADSDGAALKLGGASELGVVKQGTPETLPISNTSFTSLIERIEALEDQAVAKEKLSEDLAEIDIIKKPTIKIFGRIMLDYWGFPSRSPLVNWVGQPNTGAPFSNTNPKAFIGFRRLRLGAKGRVSETMEYKLQMEFAQPDAIIFKDAYLGWLNLPWNDKILIGNQKRPYGLAHLDSSRYMVFMERPLAIGAFNHGGSARRLGVQTYGFSENERWNWRYGGNIMQNIATTGRIYSNRFEPEINGRLANTIWYDEMSGGRGYAHWALSGGACFPNGGEAARFRTRPEAYSQTRWYDTGVITTCDTYQLGGVEGVININRLSVVGEYMGVQMQRQGLSDLEFHGGYVFVAYWLTNDYSPWNRQRGVLGRTKPNENFFIVRTKKGRQRGWGAWQIAGRLSRGDFSDQGIDGGVGQSFSFALNWWWNPNARMQFNYINGAISQRNTNNSGGGPGGNQIATIGTTSGSYNCFGTQFMIDW